MTQEQTDRLRELLAQLNMGQREAARILEVDQRELRRMCAGGRDVPAIVLVALQKLLDDRQGGRRGNE